MRVALIRSQLRIDYSHMLHVWYIYLQNWVISKANVGKYSIHEAYGIGIVVWHFHFACCFIAFVLLMAAEIT